MAGKAFWLATGKRGMLGDMSAHRRFLSQSGALPDAKSLYRDLLRTVRAFPAEPMLDLNDGGAEQGFAVVASLHIRYIARWCCLCRHRNANLGTCARLSM